MTKHENKKYRKGNYDKSMSQPGRLMGKPSSDSVRYSISYLVYMLYIYIFLVILNIFLLVS